jgi:hypothetical protein
MEPKEKITQTHFYFQNGSGDNAPIIGVEVSYDIFDLGNGKTTTVLTSHRYVDQISQEQRQAFYKQFQQTKIIQQQMLQEMEATAQ